MGTTSQKLTYLNDTKTQLKDMINYGLDTGEKITSETTFRNYVKSLFDAFIKTMTYPDVLYNNLPKVTGEGTSVTLNDTVYAPMRVELSPSALEQETTTGKNLAPSIIFDKQWSLSGSGDTRTITTSTYKKCEVVKVSPNTTYTISGDFSSLDGNVIRIAMFDNEPAINSVSTKFVFSASPYTFTTQSTTNYILLYNSSNINTTVNNLQVELGDTATSYEPYTYGASPNPQYPQQIHTVSGDNTIVSTSKDYLQGITLINGYVNSNDEIVSATNWYHSDYIDITDYDYYIVDSNQGLNPKSIIYNANKQPIQVIDLNYNLKYTYDLKSYTGAKYLRVSSTGSSIRQQHLIAKTTYPLSLADLEYCKIGDYEDVFFKNVVGSEYYDSTLELDKWYLKKNIGKVVLNGSESGWFNDGGGAPYSIHAPIKLNNSKLMVMSDYFIGVKYNASWTVYDVLVSTSIQTATNPSIKFRYTGIGGLDNFKTWLGTHNTTVYYVLSTPTYTLLSETLQTQLEAIWRANSYEDQTNVSQTNNDLPFVISASAIKNYEEI